MSFDSYAKEIQARVYARQKKWREAELAQLQSYVPPPTSRLLRARRQAKPAAPKLLPPPPVNPFAAAGGVLYTSVPQSKDVSLTYSPKGPEDGAFMKFVLEQKESSDLRRVDGPPGYDRFLKLAATGLKVLVDNAVRRMVAEPDVAIVLNLWSDGENEQKHAPPRKQTSANRLRALIRKKKNGELSPDERKEVAILYEGLPQAQKAKYARYLKAQDAEQLNYMETLHYEVTAPNRCVVDFFRSPHADRFGKRTQRGKLAAIIRDLEPLYAKYPTTAILAAIKESMPTNTPERVKLLGEFYGWESEYTTIQEIVEAGIRHGIVGDASVELHKGLTEGRGISVPELTQILNRHNIGLSTYRVDDSCSQNQDEQFTHVLHVLSHNKHMYPLRKPPTPTKPIEKIEVLESEFKVKAIVPTRLSHDLARWVDGEVQCGGKLYTMKYEHLDRELAEIYPVFGLTSAVERNFYCVSDIRARSWKAPEVVGNVVSLDLVSSHPSILRDPANVFPVADTTGHWEAHVAGAAIVPHHFYRVTVPDEPAVMRRHYGAEADMYGMTFLDHVQNDGWSVDAATRVFVVGGYVPGRASGQFGEDANHHLRHFVGVCARMDYDKKRYFRSSDPTELAELAESYGGTGVGKRCSYQGSLNDVLVVHATSPKERTGVLAWLSIYSLQERNVWRVWRALGRPPVRKIHADCIDVVLPENEDMPMVTPEGIKYHVKGTYEARPPTPAELEQRATDASPWAKMWADRARAGAPKPPPTPAPTCEFELGRSMFITGAAGVGKTHYVKNVVLPAITAAGKKYLIASSTNESLKSWGPHERAIQYYTRPELGVEGAHEELLDYDYIICDECTQLTNGTLLMLEKLVRRREPQRDHMSWDASPDRTLNIIMIGDSRQCVNVENNDYLGGETFRFLTGGRTKRIEWHAQARYTRAYYEFLEEYWRLAGESMSEAYDFVLGRVAHAGLEEARAAGRERNLCWRHEYGMTKLDGQYMTIHSAQGKTIENLYYVHELAALQDRRTVNTALSRAKDFDRIRVVVGRAGMEDTQPRPPPPEEKAKEISAADALSLEGAVHVVGSKSQRIAVSRAVIRAGARARGITCEEPQLAAGAPDELFDHVFYETVDVDKLAWIVRNPHLYPEILERAQQKCKKVDPFLLARKMLVSVVGGRLRVPYQQKSGRMYAIGARSLQGVMGRIRRTIGQSYEDIDMQNAHPTLLQHICRAHSIPTPKLDEYVADRDAVLELVGGGGLGREVAKTCILSVINGGKKELAAALLAGPCPWLSNFEAEMTYVDQALTVHPTHVAAYSAWVAKRSAEGLRNHAASFVNVLMCEAENRVLQSLVAKLKRDGKVSNDLVLVFDGLMVPRSAGVDEAYMRELEDAAYAECGVRMKLVKKPMTDVLPTPTNLPKFEGLNEIEKMLLDEGADAEFPAVFAGIEVVATGNRKGKYASGDKFVTGEAVGGRMSLTRVGGGGVVDITVGMLHSSFRPTCVVLAAPAGAVVGRVVVAWPGAGDVVGASRVK